MKLKTRIVLLGLMMASGCVVACRKGEVRVAGEVKREEVVRGGVVVAGEREFPRFLRVTGQLRAETDAVVAADAIGRVVSVMVERGSEVAAGAVLARLDTRQAVLTLAEAEAAVELAKAKLELAKNEQERNRPLAEKRAVAASDYQKLVTDVAGRTADVASAEARRDLARKVVEDGEIRTVAAGVVAERMVEPGEYVQASSAVARVVDLTRLRLVLNVPETEVAGLVVGQKVEFTTPAHAGRAFAGELKYLGAAMREATRDLVVEAAVANGDGALRPGFFCEARIRVGDEKAVAVEAEAVRTEGSRRRVFVVTAERALEERLVETGEERDGVVEIRRGLAGGERVLAKAGPDAADGVRFEEAK